MNIYSSIVEQTCLKDDLFVALNNFNWEMSQFPISTTYAIGSIGICVKVQMNGFCNKYVSYELAA